MLNYCCELLEQRQLKIAFIESASSGYLCSQFSIYKNSGADILLGGLVCYDPQIKTSLLNIDPTLIEAFTAESAEVTRALATNAPLLFPQADIIVSCTGLLKSGGSESPDKPVGTFFICIAYQEQYRQYHYQLGKDAFVSLDFLTDMVASELINWLETP